MALIKKDDLHPGIFPVVPHGQIHTLLGPEAEFQGKLIFRGAVRIEGRFRGEIVSEDTLVIGEQAEVECQLTIGTLVVNGIFRGNALASRSIELHRTGKFYGDIRSPNLIIEEGALFEGSCRMENLSNRSSEV